MRRLTTGVHSFPGQFSNENPFIGGQGTTISDITCELQNLDAEGKTVVITDPYLFPRNHKPQYRSELVGLLCGIKAAKYRYCSPRLDQLINALIEKMFCRESNHRVKRIVHVQRRLCIYHTMPYILNIIHGCYISPTWTVLIEYTSCLANGFFHLFPVGRDIHLT